MKQTILPLLSLSASALAAPAVSKREGSVYGFDISHYQESVDFAGAYSSGMRFVYIKATEGTTYKDPLFSVRLPAAHSIIDIHTNMLTRTTTLVLRTQASFVEDITSPMVTPPPATKPITSRTTAAAGLTMAELFREC
jgi:hypothetical protein